MATLQNERDKTLQASNPRLVATTVVISSSAGVLFVKPNAIDPISPTGLTLTGDTTVFTTPVVIAWYYASNEDMVWNDYDITGSNIGPNRALTSADFITHLGTSGTKVFYKAIATQTGFATAESPVFEIGYSDLSGSAGADGVDAYHIRLDNESRYVLYEYTGTPVSGSMPISAQVYVTKGALDITTGTGYVAYSVESTSGATGASVNSSTGAVTVTGITLDTNYVEIKAYITEPSTPAISVYKKLFIYKIVQPTLEVDVDVTQDHAYYQYADSSSTTNTAAWSTINLAATVRGYPNAVVTWSAKVYDTSGVEIPGTETIFTATNNTCTVSAAQFIARGGNLAARMDITATYTVGNVDVLDTAVIYRNDGTNGSRFLYANNPVLTFYADTLGDVSAAQLASEFSDLQVIDLSTDEPTDDSIGWSFNAVFGDSLGGAINEENPHVATALPIRLLLSYITANPGETIDENVVITASKSGFPSVSRTIRVRLTPPATDGYELVVDPDKTILLSVDVGNNIVGYGDATRNVWVRKGTVDDTANWTLSKTDGPGVTSTLVDGLLSVTNFAYAGTTVVFPTSGSPNYHSATVWGGSGTPIFFWKVMHNNAGRLVAVGQRNDGTGSTQWYTYVSTDNGTSWTGPNQIPNTGGTEWTSSYGAAQSFIYSKLLSKFIFVCASPTSPNGKYLHSTDGITWTLATNLPNISFITWNRILEDYAGGRIYIISADCTKIVYTTNLSSWTTVTTSGLGSGTMAIINGIGIAARSVDSSAVCNVWTSTNLTAWTSIAGSGGNGSYPGGPPGFHYHSFTSGNTLAITANTSGIYKGKIGVAVASVVGSSISWKNCILPATFYASASTAYYGIAGNTRIFASSSNTFGTSDTFSSVQNITVTGGAATISAPYNYITSTSSASYLDGEYFPQISGQYYVPMLYTNTTVGGVTGTSFWRGLVTPGNNSTESYIEVTATPDDVTLSPITTTVIVRKATYTGDVYSLVVNPGTIQLPATADGKVYPSSFTNNTNTTQYSVLKNGIPYTGNITGSIVSSTGITASVSGSSSEGTVTVTAMTDATTDGTITGTVSIDGVQGQTLSINIKVVKLKDGNTSGPRSGASVSAYSNTHTYIAVRFNPSGTVEIKRGSGGSYVYAVDWYQPVNASSPPGSNFYMTMHASSDTGDTLTLGTNGTTVGSATFSQLNVSREWILSNATTGTHRITLSPRIGTSTAGADAVVGGGVLELQVP